MFKFLFGKKGQVEAVKETQRQTAERALAELNAVLSGLSTQPRIAIAPGAAIITIDWPEQMPDEAMALPAPSSDDLTPKDPAPMAETTEPEVTADEDAAKAA